MRTIEGKVDHSHKGPKTAKELVHLLGANLSTLNFDINLTRPMPPVLPGEEGIQQFSKQLEGNNFRNLAEAIQIVHSGEKRLKRGKRFPNQDMAERYRLNATILSDMALTVGANTSLLDTTLPISEGTYRGPKTRTGELVVTFYELLLGNLNESFSGTYPANQRAMTLSSTVGFKPSPMMEKVTNGRVSSVTELLK